MVAEIAQAIGLRELPEADQIFGCTPQMQEVRIRINEATHHQHPVLIEGENGTGKEVVARYLHLNSVRAAGPFVRVNCGSIQGAMLERELFGGPEFSNTWSHGVANSSTGMVRGGTLFLDEVLEMDLSLNGRLERLLNGAASLNAQIVCTSTKALPGTAGYDDGLKDLLACFGHRVRLLSLRERKVDIPMLCEYLTGKFARSFGRPTPSLSPYVLESFQQWNWPGNVRELENWIARIVLFGTEEAVGLEFMRQMGAGVDAVGRPHRALHLNFTRPRRPRRHI